MFVLFVWPCLAISGCTAGSPVDVVSNPSPGAGAFSLSGYVLKGPVSGGTVTAYKLHGDLTAGDALSSTDTEETGFFGLALPPYNGDVRLVATGGTYVEEALPSDDRGKPRRVALDRDFLGLALNTQTGRTTVTSSLSRRAASTPRRRSPPMIRATRAASPWTGSSSDSL